MLDVVWLISGKGRQWTEGPSTGSDVMLRDLWNAFPPDVTSEEAGLPTAIPAPLFCVANQFPVDGTLASARTMRSRRRKNRVNCGPRLEHVTGSVLEEDIADQKIGTRSAWLTLCSEVR